jgi:hypothetical protein
MPADQMKALIEKDPAVVAGMEAFKFVTHRFPKGMLSFPRAVKGAG